MSIRRIRNGRTYGYMQRFADRADYRNAHDGHRDANPDERGGARPPLRVPPVHEARRACVLGRAGDRLGPGLDAHRQPRPDLPRRDGRPLVRQRRLRPPRDRRGPARRGAAARLLPRVLVDGDRPAGGARRARARPCTRRRCRRSSSATAARTRTTPRSSSSGTTTTSSGAPRRRRSSRATGATTASPSCRRASPASSRCTTASTCRCRWSGTRRRRYSLWERQAGESDEAFAQRLADELEQLIVAEGPETVAAFIGEPLQGAGGVIPPPEGYWARIQEVLRTLRRAADLRRGDHRLRPARQGLRRRGVRHRARPRDRRQGHHLRVRAAVRLPRLREGLERARRGQREARPLRPRLHVHRAPARRRGGAREPRRARERRDWSSRPPPAARICTAACTRPSTTTRSWARFAGRGHIAGVEFVGRAGSADAVRPGAARSARACTAAHSSWG